MRIQVDPHTLLQARRRGVTKREIEDVLRTGQDAPAKHGRLARFKVFPLNAAWRGIVYPQKRVEVIYVVQNCVMITVTVYAFYGQWGGES